MHMGLIHAARFGLKHIAWLLSDGHVSHAKNRSGIHLHRFLGRVWDVSLWTQHETSEAWTAPSTMYLVVAELF